METFENLGCSTGSAPALTKETKPTNSSTWSYMSTTSCPSDHSSFRDAKAPLGHVYPGPADFIHGIRISRGRDGSMSLSQKAYLQHVRERFNMADCHSAATPMDPNRQRTRHSSAPNFAPQYMQATGRLCTPCLVRDQTLRTDDPHSLSIQFYSSCDALVVYRPTCQCRALWLDFYSLRSF